MIKNVTYMAKSIAIRPRYLIPVRKMDTDHFLCDTSEDNKTWKYKSLTARGTEIMEKYVQVDGKGRLVPDEPKIVKEEKVIRSRLDVVGGEFDVEPPRAYTEEEVRAMFLKKGWAILEEWRNMDNKTEAQKMAGLYFSLLSLIDGCNADMPMFKLMPAPHEDDKEFHKKNGENWFPEEGCDIGGSLHEEMRDHEPEFKGVEVKVVGLNKKGKPTDINNTGVPVRRTNGTQLGQYI